MERNDDDRLGKLLREWVAPKSPQSLDRRVLALTGQQAHTNWWRFLVRGYVRVPVPLACCLAALMFFAGVELTRHVAPGAPCVAGNTTRATRPLASLKLCRFTQSCS